LWLTCQGIDTIMHAWPLRVMCPETLWILKVVDKIKYI